MYGIPLFLQIPLNTGELSLTRKGSPIAAQTLEARQLLRSDDETSTSSALIFDSSEYYSTDVVRRIFIAKLIFYFVKIFEVRIERKSFL